jgi:hypothetical protein
MTLACVQNCASGTRDTWGSSGVTGGGGYVTVPVLMPPRARICVRRPVSWVAVPLTLGWPQPALPITVVHCIFTPSNSGDSASIDKFPVGVYRGSFRPCPEQQRSVRVNARRGFSSSPSIVGNAL